MGRLCRGFGGHFIPHDGDRESLWLKGGTKGVMSSLGFHPTIVERPRSGSNLLTSIFRWRGPDPRRERAGLHAHARTRHRRRSDPAERRLRNLRTRRRLGPRAPPQDHGRPGPPGAKAALALTNDPGRFLSTARIASRLSASSQVHSRAPAWPSASKPSWKDGVPTRVAEPLAHRRDHLLLRRDRRAGPEASRV